MLLLDTTLTKIIWLNRSIVKAMFIQKIRFAFLKQKNFSSSNFWQSSFRCLWRSLSWLQCVEQINPKTFRSSHLRCSIKEAALKNFAIFTGKHMFWNLFLIKLEAWRCFPVNTAKFLRTPFWRTTVNGCFWTFRLPIFTYQELSFTRFQA